MRSLHLIISLVLLSLVIGVGLFIYFFVDFNDEIIFEYEFVPVDDFRELTAGISLPEHVLCNEDEYFLPCMKMMIQSDPDESFGCTELTGTYDEYNKTDLCYVAYSYSKNDFGFCRLIADVNVKSLCYGTVSKICTLNPYVDLMDGVIDYTTHFSVCEEWFKGYTESDLDEYEYLLERLETEGVSDYDDDYISNMIFMLSEDEIYHNVPLDKLLKLSLGYYSVLDNDFYFYYLGGSELFEEVES